MKRRFSNIWFTYIKSFRTDFSPTTFAATKNKGLKISPLSSNRSG